MPKTFNLLDERWLPVALDDGQREFVRLRDISQPVEGRAILRVDTGRPDCDISLTEFLIGLLAVAMGPTDPGTWRDRYHTPPTSAQLEACLTPFASALILDGDGPRFFQDLEPLDGSPTPIEALFIDAPGNNAIKDNADHFVKRGRTGVLSRDGAAIALLTLQISAPAGGAGHRTSLRGGGPLTTLVVPRGLDGAEPTLWQRLWANVPAGLGATAEDATRIFPWLVATRTSDPKNKGQITSPEDVHPAQAFFGMPRRIRLVFEPNTDRAPCDLLGIVDDVIVTSYVTRPWGTNYSAWSQGHPLSPYYKLKEADTEMLPLHLQSSRIGYRQWLGLATDGNTLRTPSGCIHEFKRVRARRLGTTERNSVRLLACGYAMDNMKPLDFAEALMPLIVTDSDKGDEEIANNAVAMIGAAEAAAMQLGSSVKLALYGEGRKTDSGTSVLQAVRARFWAETEEPFYDLLQEAAGKINAAGERIEDMNIALAGSIGAQWLAVLERIALAIFDDTAPIDSAEAAGISDLIAGRKFLSLAFQGQLKSGKAIFAALGIAQTSRKSPRGSPRKPPNQPPPSDGRTQP